MKDLTPLGPGAYDSDPDEEFLVKHDSYVQAEARKVFPSELFSEDISGLEIGELQQIIRIKLWKACQKSTISNPKAYIRKVAYTTAVDMIRQHKPTVFLSTDINGESNLDDLQLAQNEEFRDPAYEIELGEINPSLLMKLIGAILSLPPRQRQAVFLSLKEHQDEIAPLVNALKDKGIDIEAMDWPKEEHEIYLLKASLSVARKKLRGLLHEFISG